jgi:S1-C subfamily serine protease
MTLIALMMLATDPMAGEMPDVVLLDFTAGYCPPCQQMVPTIQKLQKEGFPIRKVDTTEQPNVTRQYNVDRIPTFILLVEGRETQRLTGLRSESELRRIMENAQEELDSRKTASAPPEPNPPKTARRREKEASGGLRGILARLSNGLVGNSRKSGFQHPTFRAQSPDQTSEEFSGEGLMAATVRVHVDGEGGKQDVGTGSIIHSVQGESIILTCAHLFRDSGSNPNVIVDVFKDGRVLKYPAKVVRGNHHSDLAILQIQNKEPLPRVSLAPMDEEVAEGASAFSIGCNQGQPPSHLAVKVVSLDRYDVNIPSHLVCSVDPAVGRSGGGLFNDAGQLIGVCSCADREQHEGLYMGREPIHALFEKAGLTSLLTPQVAADEPEVFASAESDDSSFDEDELIATLFGDVDNDRGKETEIDFSEASAEFELSPSENPPTVQAELSATSQQKKTDANVPAAITVIVDSTDGSGRKEMIVIEKPTPWLMELLTGRQPAEQQVALARKVNLCPTSAQTVRRRPAVLPRAAISPRDTRHVGHHSY